MGTIGSTPLDSGNIPLASVMVLGQVNPVPLQGSTLIQTDILQNQSTGLSVEINRVNGALLSPKNPVIVEQSIQNWLRLGQMFAATTGRLTTITNANLIEGMSLFNPAASGKNILVLSAKIVQSQASTSNQLNLTTIDPAFATVLTPANLSAGGGASVLTTSVTCAANSVATSVAVAGTQIDTAMIAGVAPYEFLSPGMGVLLPAGAASGVAVFATIVSAAQFYAITLRWVEFS